MLVQELVAQAKEKYPDCETVGELCKQAVTLVGEAAAAEAHKVKAISARDQVYVTLRVAVEKARMRANGAWLRAIADEEAEVAERIMGKAGHKPESPTTEGKGWMDPLPSITGASKAQGDHHGPEI